MTGVFAGEESVGLREGIVVVVKGGYRQNHCRLDYRNVYQYHAKSRMNELKHEKMSGVTDSGKKEG